jgi:ribosomal protein S18 acetylase RimI-like enzyme
VRPVTGDGPRTELRAALSFLAEVDDAVAGEVVSLPWGTGVFDRARPRVWDANYVRVASAGEMSAAELAEAGEPVFSERGLAHRMLVFDDRDRAERLAPGFAELGWESAHEVVMVSRRPPATPAHQVAEISIPSYEESKRAVELAEPPGGVDPAIAAELADQLASRDALIREVAAERRFGVVVDGRVVSACVLYSLHGVGQVESVTTEPGHRDRGYGRAIVEAATSASVNRGDDLTFLVALVDDWPREMYRRLGFEPVGQIHRFRLSPKP